jgi:tetratricopeptide (TPR) repeat protein
LSHGKPDLLRKGEQAEAEIGKAPHKTAVIVSTNLLQWALYYPGIIDPGELGLSRAEEASVAASLAAYREGDLLGALEKYPKNYRPNSAAARLYQAGVVLAVGRVDEARRQLSGVRSDAPGRRALEEMIAAVNFLEHDISKTPSTASGWLARSYYLQSRDEPGRIEMALDAARRAEALAPDFGYAAVRVAELEFSQGRIESALRELARNPHNSARNAQAHALRGFLLSAQNRIDAARSEFQTAIDLDGALGNGWLGRGLCAIRQGRDDAGRLDLQIAATVEPNRSLLHSYLGKAFSEIGDNKSANKDLARAKELDLNDPTPWLYSAIQRKQENRYNEAIADLEKSIELNENRRLYRSEFLLDQDLAIRNANLASIYRNNGMIEQSVREAVRAVNNDYASAPAHLFLSNSYNELR